MHLRLTFLALVLVICPAPPRAVGKYVKQGGNFLEVTASENGQFKVSLSGSYGMNTCHIDTGPQRMENCEITYNDKEDEDCKVRISLSARSARVEQHGECGCGLNVNLSGLYRKQPKLVNKGSH